MIDEDLVVSYSDVQALCLVFWFIHKSTKLVCDSFDIDGYKRGFHLWIETEKRPIKLYPTTGTWMVKLKDSGLERFEKDHPERHDEQYLMKVLLVRFNMNCYSLYSLRAGLYSY